MNEDQMRIRVLLAATITFGTLIAVGPLSATLCVPGSTPAQRKPAPPTPPVCEPKVCDRCSKSPCNLASGGYIDDFVDLQIPTAGRYPLTVSRRYDSNLAAKGALGTGWSS